MDTNLGREEDMTDCSTGSCKKNVPLFKFPASAAARQTDQPMHGLSAKTEHLQKQFTQLTELSFCSTLYSNTCITANGTLSLLFSDSRLSLDYGIESAFLHPDFSEKDFSADVAVVRLRRAVPKFTDRVRPICLPFGFATAGCVKWLYK